MQTFTADTWLQSHAREWAVDHLHRGDERADLFVAWLCTLSDEEQDRIVTEGYRSAVDAFEADMLVGQQYSPDQYYQDGE